MGITRRLAIAAGATLVAAPSAHGAEERDVVRRVRRACERMARDEGLSGAVLLARNGAPVFRAAYGMRNRADRAPNRIDTKFNLASIGKLFTSLAVLRLVDAGRLSLDSTLESVWPDYPNREVAAAVTIAQLLSHSAGVPNYVVEAMRTPPQSLVTLSDTLALFVNQPLTQTPGALFEYSNGGYIILGCLVEKLTGEDFFDHCRRTIFAPLGMRDTDAFRADDIVPNLAVGYLRDLERPGVWRNNTFDVFRGTAAGGSYSTLDDLLSFANAFTRGELLSPALMQEWKRPRFHYHRGQYGLGVSQAVINNHPIVGHAGGH
ncbi:MAG: beta-lactamase family protein, partial [Hyphomonadaceae bacterium]|nr:beta-lactamase family protein [Hyphomonadaceae bacterium]